MWRAVSQLLSRAVIETPFNLLNLLRRQTRKRAVLGQVLTDQRIGVLDVWLVCRAVGARKKQAPLNCPQCSYCDFYTQTGSRLRQNFINALIRELHLRREELPDSTFIEHIYFGGGTPSLLTPDELTRIFTTITSLYPLTGSGEVTIECNPDDVTADYAQALGTLPINRVSMGVQSFHADDLSFLNRRHSAEQVFSAVEALRHQGINNLSLDLIYGLPGQTEERWLANIRTFLSLGVPHLSAYHLIYEEGTALTRLVERGKIQPVSKDDSLRFFELLISELKVAGYEHYEISNFALPDRYARHNTGYWQGVPYLGLGPSAHSFDGVRTRSHNVASLAHYTRALLEGQRDYETEYLSDEELQHEYILTRLRTQWGIPLADYTARFGEHATNLLLQAAKEHINRDQLTHSEDTLRLTPSGIFVSDGIIADLFQ